MTNSDNERYLMAIIAAAAPAIDYTQLAVGYVTSQPGEHLTQIRTEIASTIAEGDWLTDDDAATLIRAVEHLEKLKADPDAPGAHADMAEVMAYIFEALPSWSKLGDYGAVRRGFANVSLRHNELLNENDVLPF